VQSVWKTSIRFTLVTTVILGLGYPLLVTGLATLFFPHQAAGSLILKDGKVIGSELLAQSFTSDKYFHPRPSAAGNGYDAQNSSGSNLAPSNKALVDRIQGDIDKLAKENPSKPVPIDMVTTSGSGLDPDITPDAVDFQLQRVINARGFKDGQVEQLKKLIETMTTGRQFKILGEPRVNVLELNLELDKIK
jgi:K+-transporting ATPase ATPase C chain